jgi:hypothetical protein
MMEEVVYLHKQQWPDSIEIGTPSKGGGLKIYFNASNPEETDDRIKKAYEALKRAREMVKE